jgi:hypothetical protein
MAPAVVGAYLRSMLQFSIEGDERNVLPLWQFYLNHIRVQTAAQNGPDHTEIRRMHIPCVPL